MRYSGTNPFGVEATPDQSGNRPKCERCGVNPQLANIRDETGKDRRFCGHCYEEWMARKAKGGW